MPTGVVSDDGEGPARAGPAAARRFAFVFVIQAGPLVNKALLLAATLARQLEMPHELIAATPTPAERWGTLPAYACGMLDSLGVRRVSITNDIADDYPIGNKVSCLAATTEADRIVFIDSDILLLRRFSDDPRFDPPFAAKPADLANTLTPRQWRRAYGACGVAPLEGRMPASVDGALVQPYFNAGFIVADARVGLGEAWLACCRRIDRRWGVPLKRPHLDQIALPVAVRKLGLTYHCLDERFNFPAHLKPLDNDAPPIVAHYHSLDVLRREPALVEAVQQECDAHPMLADRLRADADYAPLLKRPPRPVRKAGPRTPELILTGIPRSGTSYLCNLLHRYDNCIVLNEPEGISRPLRKQAIPFGVGTFYRDIRRDILEGRPIRNKLKDGKVTDETMEANEQADYIPSVVSDDFVLGAKSPLSFLSRLDALRRAMPRARMVACVRNPLDTLASWKTTFSHLQSADVASQTHGGLRDPFLSARHRAALEEVARLRHPAWRRAAWWRWLAELILDAGPTLLIIPYPRLAADPSGVLDDVLKGFNPGALREPIEPTTPRAAKRSALDEEDQQAIRALCSEAAAALGVGAE